MSLDKADELLTPSELRQAGAEAGRQAAAARLLGYDEGSVQAWQETADLANSVAEDPLWLEWLLHPLPADWT